VSTCQGATRYSSSSTTASRQSSDTVLIDTRKLAAARERRPIRPCPSGRWCSRWSRLVGCRRRSSDLSLVVRLQAPRSHATLTDDTAPSPAFVVDLPAGTTCSSLSTTAPWTAAPTPSSSIPGIRVRSRTRSRPDRCDGATVQLDGRGSSDADHDPLGLRWSFVSRPPKLGTLSDVTAPADLRRGCDRRYVVQLIVNDGTVDSAPATVGVTANPRQVINRPS